VVRRERPDVVHAHNPAASAASAVARVLARRADLPIVTTYHGLVSGRATAAARLLRATADVVVGIGPAATSELVRAGIERDHLATVLNAVDARTTRPPGSVRAELGL